MLIRCPKCRGTGRGYVSDCAFCEGSGQVSHGTRYKWFWDWRSFRLVRVLIVRCRCCKRIHPAPWPVCLQCGYNMRYPEPCPGAFPNPWFPALGGKTSREAWQDWRSQRRP